MLSNIREKGNRAAMPTAATGLSLLAVMVSTALYTTQAQAEEAADTLVVSADAGNGSTNTDAQDYTVKTTTAGTKMLLVPRDVPQSVSIISKQRMADQNLQTVSDVLNNTTAISPVVADSDRVTFYSRGFLITNFLYDDIPTTISDVWNFGDQAGDTAIYDRIEVVRGATGLMSGAGNPSASVNMVRKHADSRELTGSLSASYGSWDKQRYVADVSAPLTDSGNVRGRVVAGYQDNDTWLDRYHSRKKFFYGVIDADLTDSTTLSVGYDYQDSHTSDPTWGGIPTWYSDGSRTHYDRSFNAAPDWAYTDIDSKKVFATLTQRFDSGWLMKVNGSHDETKFDSRLMYPSGYPDKTTGSGVMGYGGWNTGKRKIDALDAYASGPFELFGRQHELVAGVSYSRQNNHYFNTQSTLSESDIGNYNQWDGNIAYPTWSPWVDYQNDTVIQKSAYTAVRFSVTDPLHLIAGARYTNWRAGGSTTNDQEDDVTPYAGVVYDINDAWSAYASYTSIFQPQQYRDSNNNYLKPVKGKSYETGVKSDWFNGRLTTSLSLFRIEQDNVAQSDGSYIPGSQELAYTPVQGTVSRGVEFELNGALTDNWQMTFGASRYIAKAKDGTAVNPNLPRTQLKLFTRYQLPMLRDLTVGGGVNWQNATWKEGDGPLGTMRAEQGSYALVNLFARYQITKQLSVQGNINNLFDKEYYDYLDIYAVYGAPRNASVTLNYDF
ncbi:ferric-rhodotorulic acid/ferric-coprogen receptor FhuE [Nissabacter sp. SGAir0207]|uniref:ferric-rhodotorulic acid/ferric-coprogen receptor FhuE n=1 Tax=Nissabacter sp. SGAir0207 TaxID=2126321 RepID=UPI0010CCD630|nr:ferric-rhodotorulic acid/ferric-coprogen receptor FhuE [Nissabacter sp. SGAir0207]QCR38167.1 ferric-rhodotorulic acid/ferric-coprogen receptor FhuE [Nissabacter sp. SGAir0207]